MLDIRANQNVTGILEARIAIKRSSVGIQPVCAEHPRTHRMLGCLYLQVPVPHLPHLLPLWPWVSWPAWTTQIQTYSKSRLECITFYSNMKIHPIQWTSNAGLLDLLKAKQKRWYALAAGLIGFWSIKQGIFNVFAGISFQTMPQSLNTHYQQKEVSEIASLSLRQLCFNFTVLCEWHQFLWTGFN